MIGYGFYTSFLMTVLIYCVALIAAYWSMFKKAGERGWKALIPLYNTYILFKISWKPAYFWLSTVLAVCTVFANFASEASLDMMTAAFASLCSITSLIVNLVLYYKLSRAYGHGIGFAIGLVFLNPIFVLILGYGKSEYVGADL